jgi:hypothetical protein
MIKKIIMLATILWAGVFAGQIKNGGFFLSTRYDVPMGLSAMAMGGALEVGAILDNGLFITAESVGGAYYYGGLANFGYCFGRNRPQKSVLGVSGGYHNVIIKTDLTYNDVLHKTVKHNHASFGGVFYKQMFGVLDITNRALFGRRPDYTYTEIPGGMFSYDVLRKYKFNVTYSASIGFSVPGIRRSVRDYVPVILPQPLPQVIDTDTFTISVVYNSESGVVIPSGEIRVEIGASKDFRIIPNPGFVFDGLVLNGELVQAANASPSPEFTLRNIQENTTIEALFREEEVVDYEE